MCTPGRGAKRGRGWLRGAAPVALAAALVSPAVSPACGSSGPAEKKDALVVRDLDIEGAHRIPPRQIKKKIITEETGWWWPLARKRYFDPVAWHSDLQRIRRLYEARGYYQAEVTRDEVRPDGKGGVALTAAVNEGEPTRIGTLQIRGLEQLPAEEREEVLDDLPVKVGEVFQEAGWDAAKAGIEKRLRDLGYAEVTLDAEALVDVKTRTAALAIVVRPGLRYRFAEIEVKLPPLSRIDPRWIWEEVRIAIPDGEWFSGEALAEAQRRVFAMGVFAMAKVTTGTPDPSRARVPVVVDAREAPFHSLRAGGGARVDQIRNEARLTLEWTHRNFRGGMRRLTARAQPGWAFIPNFYAVLSNDVESGPRHGPIARLGLELEQPRLGGWTPLRGRAAVDLERTLEQTYNALGGRFAAGVSWRPRASLFVYPTYNFQAYYLQGPALASAATAPLALGCIAEGPNCFVLLSYLEQVLTWDRRDHLLEPRRGFYASLSLQEGGGPLGGDFTFLRVLPDVRGYVSFGEDDWVTVAGRLRVGMLWPRAGQESATVSRFFAGGGISMRGFSDRRLSPLLLAPAPPSPGSEPVTLTLPIGGNGMIDGSWEVRTRVTSSLIVAAFVDFGQVTGGGLGPGDVRHMLWAVGAGVRYLTPVGPIRLDIARRLPVGRPPPLLSIDEATGVVTEVPYEVDDSCFGLGGSGTSTVVKDNMCVLHLSIGEAF
jgi:translocation and assembly module TamA